MLEDRANPNYKSLNRIESGNDNCQESFVDFGKVTLALEKSNMNVPEH